MVPGNSNNSFRKDHTEQPIPYQGKRTDLASSSPQVLKNVVIPASRSSLGSSLSSVHCNTSDSETPATSVAVTPADILPPKRHIRKLTRTPAPVPLASSTKSKRKRTAEDDLLDNDELLARTLQEREWVEDITTKTATKRRRRLIQDSSDDDIGASRGESETYQDSSDDDPPFANKGKNVIQNRLPSRAARDSARKAINFKNSRSVQDSEEDDDALELSDISAFTVDQDFSEAFDDSEEAHDNFDAVSDMRASASPAEIDTSGQGSTSNATRRSTARGRPARSSNRAPRRRWQGTEDRSVRERKKLEKAHPGITTMWNELRAVPRITGSKMQQPDTITRELKSFQLEGLDWMTKQEKSQWKGGLLGDEMGMGKTIQAVSLIMSDYPAPNPTLVVVPPVALIQWQNEIEQYTDGKLKVLVYHNTNPKVKTLKSKDLRAFDVIMISYSGLESIYRKESKGWKRDDGLVKENSKIHAIYYHRLILDEAHNIKTRTTSVARACFALQADYKWCLSGTPVQNRIGEFFSLLRFLEIRPFASYFCKRCPCAELHWNQDADKRCSNCQHTGFEHVSIFNQELLNPITQQGDPELRRAALQKLRLITDRIMLRRMKRDYTASMELPPKEVIVHSEFFGEIERDFSSSIMSNTTRQFDTYVSRGVMLNNYANIFGLIMQVRCHYLIPETFWLWFVCV